MITCAILICSIVTLSLSTYANKKDSIQSADLEKYLNASIEKSSGTPRITRDEAINIARKDFLDVKDSTKIKAQYNLMTYKDFTAFSEEELTKNPKLKAIGHLQKAPVWIVSFKGLNITRSGGVNITDEQKKQTAHTEENVVIDAETGEPLFSFSFR